MSTSFSIADILADVATLCNVPPFTTTSHTTSTRATYWIHQSVRALSAMYRQKLGRDNDFVQTATLTTVPGLALVSLPADCGEVHAIVWQKSATDHQILASANLDEVADNVAPENAWTFAPKYRLEGSAIALYPLSNESETLTVYYTNHTDSSGVDIQARLDSDRWITLDVAARVLQSKERDAGVLVADKAVLEANLFSPARARDPYVVNTIRDTRSRSRTSYRDRWGF